MQQLRLHGLRQGWFTFQGIDNLYNLRRLELQEHIFSETFQGREKAGYEHRKIRSENLSTRM